MKGDTRSVDYSSFHLYPHRTRKAPKACAWAMAAAFVSALPVASRVLGLIDVVDCG